MDLSAGSGGELKESPGSRAEREKSAAPGSRNSSLRPEISVVIPAFNEEPRIRRSLEEVLAWLSGRFTRFEVIVVDDGSVDGTAAAVSALCHPAVRLLSNPANTGKGFSVRRGVKEARYDPILFTDADLSTPIGEMEKLLREIDAGSDLAIASRRKAGSQVRRSVPRRFLGWGFSLLVSLLAVKGFRDTQCGFKLFRRRAAAELFPLQTIDRWGFDVELLAIARRLDLSVAEVPVRWTQSGKSQIRLSTPLEMACELARIRRNSRRGLYGPARKRG
jgi:dolichyl-phosphate beta-glucosyltransferase